MEAWRAMEARTVWLTKVEDLTRLLTRAALMGWKIRLVTGGIEGNLKEGMNELAKWML